MARARRVDINNAVAQTIAQLNLAQANLGGVIGRANVNLGQQITAARQGLERVGEKIKTDTHDMQRYAITATLGDAVIGFGTSTARMVQAFQAGRDIEGGGEILKMAGSVAKLAFLGSRLASGVAAAWLGPIGIMVGDILIALGSSLIDGFAPQQKSVAEQLRAELAEFGGLENADRLQGVLDSLQLVQADLQSRERGSLTWDEVNRIGRFTGPDEVIWLGMAENWLRRETKTEVWTTVLEAYSVVSGRYLQNLIIGLDRMKKYENDKPTHNIGEALSVLARICEQRDEMLSEVRPRAAALATRWFIGSNDNIYRADNTGDEKIGFHDTAARSIALGSDGERIWHLGNDRTIYTMSKGSWSQLPGTCERFDAVQEVGTGKTRIITLQGMRLTMRTWDESRNEEVKLEPTALVEEIVVDKVKSFAGTTSGKVLLLDDRGNLWLHEGTDNRGLAVPDGTVKSSGSQPRATSLIGLAARDTDVYVYSSQQIWSRPLGEIDDAAIGWEKLTVPGREALGLGEGWQYEDVSVGADGTLMAIIDSRMYSFVDDVWSPTDGNTAKRVVSYPVRGWQELVALTSIVEDVKAGVAELEREPEADEPS